MQSWYYGHMFKRNLRQSVLKKLKRQDKSLKKRYDLELLDCFLSLSAYKLAKTIAIYLAFEFEYNTQLIINRAVLDGKRIVIPKTYPEGRMIFVTYDPDDLSETEFGLLEPMSHQEVEKSDIDLMLVPGLVFNRSGFRIGFGAGYYDRYLKDFKGKTASLIYPCQMGEFTPDSHDIAVQEVFCAAN